MFGTLIGLILKMHPTGISALEELGFPCRHGSSVTNTSTPRESPLEMPLRVAPICPTDTATEVELGLQLHSFETLKMGTESSSLFFFFAVLGIELMAS